MLSTACTLDIQTDKSCASTQCHASPTQPPVAHHTTSPWNPIPSTYASTSSSSSPAASTAVQGGGGGVGAPGGVVGAGGVVEGGTEVEVVVAGPHALAQAGGEEVVGRARLLAGAGLAWRVGGARVRHAATLLQPFLHTVSVAGHTLRALLTDWPLSVIPVSISTHFKAAPQELTAQVHSQCLPLVFTTETFMAKYCCMPIQVEWSVTLKVII